MAAATSTPRPSLRSSLPSSTWQLGRVGGIENGELDSVEAHQAVECAKPKVAVWRQDDGRGGVFRQPAFCLSAIDQIIRVGTKRWLGGSPGPHPQDGQPSPHTLELHPRANDQAVIAMLGHDTARVCFGILQVVPNEGDVQVKMPFDFELERGHRMVRVQARILAG